MNASSDLATDQPTPAPASAPGSSLVARFRVVALLEAVSLVLLLAASVAKRGFDMEQFVPVMGPIHGVIFLAYFALAARVRDELEWTLGQTLVVIFAAAVPLGGLFVERRYLPAR